MTTKCLQVICLIGRDLCLTDLCQRKLLKMSGKITNGRLQKAFSFSEDIKSEVRRKDSSNPAHHNGKGTPMPLYASFKEGIELEPDFLPQYFDMCEKNFFQANILDLNKYISEVGSGDTLQEQESEELKFIYIEYDRKDIYLSRVIFNLFEMPDSSVAKGSAPYFNVLERNESYQKALEKREKCPENYIEKTLQTDFIDSMEKQIETIPILIENKKCMVNNYLMEKHYERSEIKVKPPPQTFEQFGISKTRFHDYSEFLNSIETFPDILSRVQKSLYVIEKTLNYNSFKNSVLEYNSSNVDLPDIVAFMGADIEGVSSEKISVATEGYNIKNHLRFHLEKMKNYQVTCIECSPVNPSIFVVGYGASKYNETNCNPRGMVLCWNIHKCGYPEKIYHTEEIVTSLEFSRVKPYLVAVGMRYGLIAVFDLRRSMLFSSLNNYSSNVKPLSSIQNIRWMKRKYAMDKEIEVLLSVSMDGIIICWSLGKMLNGRTVRGVKRGENTTGGKNVMIAVDAAGMCMQVKPDDDNIFLVGTAEGQALQADINDPDSYTFFYDCHNGPLYDLKWSPLVPGVFMTCGTDHFIHILQTGRKKPAKSLVLKEVALNVTWSCIKSTLFAAMCKNKVLIFDLSINLHKEIADLSPTKPDLSFTSATFCPKNDWFLVGQSDGIIELYELVDIPPLTVSQEAALKSTFLSEDVL